VEFLFVPWSFCLCREVFVCAVEFLFVPWSFCLCREVFVCAVTISCLCRDPYGPP
jgi:hypothetical protein